MSGDARLDYSATNRNREPILKVLREFLPARGTVLEIASGSGQHAAFFGGALPELRWQPSDREGALFASIRAWTEGLSNVAAPILVDASSFTGAPEVPPARPGRERTESRPALEPHFEAIFCANMIHIAPWEACLGLLAMAGEHLAPAGKLVLYGPFMRAGAHTALSNEAFDRRLKSRDPRWGVRDLEVVSERAATHGLRLEAALDMPANNLSVVFSAPE